MRFARVWIGLVACLVLLPPLAVGSPPTLPTHGPAPSVGAVGTGPRPAGAAAVPGPLGPPATLLVEVSTGEVLQASEQHRRYPPASLDKLMTLYLTLKAMRTGRLKPDSPVTVSAAAWRIGRTPGSSRMFLNAGDVVSVSQLLEGLMIASGNDAAEALAEAVAGSGEQFVEEMNAAASRLGMRDTRFVTPHGLPVPGEYTSAADMALLARAILLDDPEAVRFSSPREETYGGIRQLNWNNLVFRDARVDGLKTGHTRESGFSIVATAHEGEMRLIAVVMGAPTLQRRTALTEGLLNTGFSHYVLAPVPWQKIVPDTLRVYGATARTLPVEPARPLKVLARRDAHPVLEVSEEITAPPFAPFHRGQPVGVLTVGRDGRVIATVPLVAAATVERTGVVGRMWGFLRYTAGRLLHRHPSSSRGTVTLGG